MNKILCKLFGHQWQWRWWRKKEHGVFICMRCGKVEQKDNE